MKSRTGNKIKSGNEFGSCNYRVTKKAPPGNYILSFVGLSEKNSRVMLVKIVCRMVYGTENPQHDSVVVL